MKQVQFQSGRFEVTIHMSALSDRYKMEINLILLFPISTVKQDTNIPSL
jgi:hypothetical protein